MRGHQEPTTPHKGGLQTTAAPAKQLVTAQRTFNQDFFSSMIFNDDGNSSPETNVQNAKASAAGKKPLLSQPHE